MKKPNNCNDNYVHIDEIEKAFYNFIQSDIFKIKIESYTHKTVKEIYKSIRNITGIFIIMIFSLCIYIFQTTNENVKYLTKTTINLDKSIVEVSKSLDFIRENTRENTKRINKINPHINETGKK